MLEIKMPDTSILEFVRKGDIYNIPKSHPSTKYFDVRYQYPTMNLFDTVEVLGVEKIDSPILNHYSYVLAFKNDKEEIKTSVFSFSLFAKFLEESIKLNLDYGKNNNVYQSFGKEFLLQKEFKDELLGVLKNAFNKLKIEPTHEVEEKVHVSYDGLNYSDEDDFWITDCEEFKESFSKEKNIAPEKIEINKDGDEIYLSYYVTKQKNEKQIYKESAERFERLVWFSVRDMFTEKGYKVVPINDFEKNKEYLKKDFLYSNFLNCNYDKIFEYYINRFKENEVQIEDESTALDKLVANFEESEKSIFSSNKFYHGSSVKFDEFDLSKAKDGWFGKCIYFTDNKTLAKGFGKYIYEVELDIKNPYFTKSDNWMQIVNDVNKEFNADGLQETDLTKVLDKNGFDGIVFNTNWDKSVGNIYTVVNPNQIKIVSVEENKKRNFNKTK